MDIYTWQAVHHDESVTPEFDADRPDGRGFAEVVRPVKRLQLSKPDQWHRVAIPEGATPTFFRRRKIATNPVTGLHERSTVAHCIGWKRGEQECYLFVFEDGSTLLTSDLQAV